MFVGSSAQCSQTVYALRVLRAHGMCTEAVQAIFRSVAIAKLLYASSAWSGFIKAADRQRVDAFLARCKRVEYCAADLPPFQELLKTADQQLFTKLTNCDTHLLHGLLPPPAIASQNYSLRPRNHNRQLPEHSGHLMDSNFITRLLYLGCY